jgi:hypothetical protein
MAHSFWCGLILVLLSIVGTACLIKARCDAVALEEDALDVEGTVIGKWYKPSRCMIAYEFSVNGSFFRDEARVTPEHYARLKAGGPVSVKVCRGDPANHQVVGAFPRVFSTRATVPFYAGMLMLLGGGGIVCLWLSWASRPPQSRGRVEESS